MIFIFAEKLFYLSVFLKVIHSSQYWLDIIFFKVILEIAALTFVITNFMGNN
jgi:hypothetical protein